ncbi:DUF2268 domain-containing protein [Bacillus sp. FJAT-22090]|uniref:DUF2268 domain-containing protein n=1 Tax=Bacillus sp. FJAT-22090 TaxID=1581038 RepID=UPI0016431D37|nr:DUF2268 domain-containing putative Zn-dependent protease [Bacillus sp. FJAT-22090]
MRGLINFSTLLLMVIFISGCTEVKEQNKEIQEEEHEKVDDDNTPIETTYHFSYKGQEFEIISFFDEVLEYARIISEKPELDKKAIYTEHVLEPFKDKSSLHYLELGVTENDPLRPTSQVEQLEKNTNELLKKQEQINQWIEEAILESAELLSSGSNTSIYLFPVNPENSFTRYNLNGVGGFAYFGDNVLLMIDPTASKEVIKYTMAHEYHHTVNMTLNGEQSVNSVLDFILTEGKADSFATILYPEINPPWIQPLPEDITARVLEELRINGNSTDYKIYNRFVYGYPAKDIPRWSNYKIGYQINESFIENNPDSSILEWTKTNADEIVSKSKYKDKIFQ